MLTTKAFDTERDIKYKVCMKKKIFTEGWKEGFNLIEMRSCLLSSQVGERAPGEIKQHSHIYTRETACTSGQRKSHCLVSARTELEGLRYEKLILPAPKPVCNFVQNFVFSQLSCHPFKKKNKPLVCWSHYLKAAGHSVVALRTLQPNAEFLVFCLPEHSVCYNPEFSPYHWHLSLLSAENWLTVWLYL